jgi:hypothetical protein
MRRMMLLAGAAALVAAIPAVASSEDRGGGRGRGNDTHPAQKGGGGHGRAEHGRGHGKQTRADPGPGRGADRGGRDARELNHQERRVEQAIREERREVDRARGKQAPRQARLVDARDANDARLVRADRRDWQGWSARPIAPRDRFGTLVVPYRPFPAPRGVSAPAFCPPGLARKNRYCLPPGQLRRARFIGRPLALSARPYNVPVRYAYRFVDNDRHFYRYDAGTIFAFDRSSGLVTRVVPLASTGLFPGEPLPLGYDVYNVPFAYRAAYPDSADSYYRYDDDAIYRVDAESGLVDGIVALLTGSGGLGGLGVGDPMPVGYDAYNVPIAYRDTYFDRGDALFRYADGSIYQVDPQTRLIEAVISMIA